MRKSYYGTCAICGEKDVKLSYEHVPPESAFNNCLAIRALQKDIFNKSWDGKHGEYLQKGSGAHTLCERCNNNTGHWYGAEYVSWAKQGLLYIQAIHPEDESEFFVRFEGYPLRLLKQVIVMHFSTNSNEKFANIHSELVKFVLNPKSKDLPPRYKIDLILVRGKYHRSTGTYILKDIFTGKNMVASEIAHFPFSFILRFVNDNDGEPTMARYGRIEQFSEYDYDEKLNLWLKTRAGHITNVNLPGDYRSPARLQRDRERAELEEAYEKNQKRIIF